MDERSPVRDREAGAANSGESLPRYRPRDRFWPYVDLPEEPTAEELAALDPDLQMALAPSVPRPFSLTVVFPRLDSPDYARAVELARQASEYREVGAGDAFRHRARFRPSEASALHALWDIVGRFDACELLIDDRPLPYARELWLPLVWFLLIR